MKCCKCSGEFFEQRIVRFTPTIKKEIVEIIVPSNICLACNSPLLSTEQVNFFRKAAVDKFRESHGLLTSKDIIALREIFGLSQRAFAEYLGVGEASIKRWETYYVQDASQDDHIRLKCDLSYAELHYLKLLRQFSYPDQFNGLRSFSFDLFKQLVLFFLNNAQLNSARLAKLSFYVDFLNFKRVNKSMTGMRYVPTKFGPAPEHCLLLLKILERQKCITHNSLGYQKNADSNLTLFDYSEIQSINYVYDSFYKKNHCITMLSKNERAFTETNDFCYISYKFSNDLLI